MSHDEGLIDTCVVNSHLAARSVTTTIILVNVGRVPSSSLLPLATLKVELSFVLANSV